MLKILSCGKSVGRAGLIRYCVCEILADTEEDILGLNTGNTIGNIVPVPGSTARTADESTLYVLSPSNVWVKNIKGATALDSTLMEMGESGELLLHDWGKAYYEMNEEGDYYKVEVSTEHPWKTGLLPAVIEEEDGVPRLVWRTPNSFLKTKVADLLDRMIDVENDTTLHWSWIEKFKGDFGNYYTKEEIDAKFAALTPAAAETGDDTGENE